MASWTDEETLKLIELWGDDRIQAQLEGCKRNKEVYERIAREMAEAGLEKTAEQCREKAKKLKAEYRKVKDNHSKTGQGRKKWKFLEAMDMVLADKPSTRPPVLIDTLSKEVRPEQELQVEGTVEQEPSCSGLSSRDEGDDQQETFTEGEESNTPSSRGRSVTPTEKKGKKRSREEKMENTLMTVVDRMMSAQEASDVKFMTLEEKRMKFEERLLETEERQRREEREFQMRMWTMLMQGMHVQPQLPAVGVSLGAQLPPGMCHAPPIPPGPSAPPSASHLYRAPSPHMYEFPTSYDRVDEDEQNL